MNFSKRQNEFCDIPGCDASKSERILKALHKLLEKIQYLEQNRTSEKKSKSDASCSSKDEDLTITDVQYKLLLLQLQYVRSLVRKNSRQNSEISQTKTRKANQDCTLSTTARNVTRGDELHSSIVNKPDSANVHTASNSIADFNSAKSSSIEDKSKSCRGTSDKHLPRFKHSTEESTAACEKIVPSTSKPHYHLKLDDVPFILGSSSTESHSVVANLQNIIAMMKSHNKALCGPKPPVTKTTVANTHSTDFIAKATAGKTSQDNTRMLNDLTRDLYELAMKQQRLVKDFDATQIKTQDPETNSARNNQTHANKISYKPIEQNSSRTHRSHSEPAVKLHAEVKKIPKVKERDLKHYINPKPSTVRSQPSNPSIMDRRKLLRSLQDFKKHLSEEDISWK